MFNYILSSKNNLYRVYIIVMRIVPNQYRPILYNKNLPPKSSIPSFKGIKPQILDPFFDDLFYSFKIDDKELAKIFPGRINIAKDFLNLEGYNLDAIYSLKDKKKAEFKYLYEIASKKDLTGQIRIPVNKLNDFSLIPYEKLKCIEPVVLSKNDLGLWNYEPSYILKLLNLDPKKLDLFIELAKCKVTPFSTNAILKDNDINWEKTVQKAQSLKQLYGNNLREIEFYSNHKNENLFLVDIQLPHSESKSDWSNFKRICVKLDDDVNPISRNKTYASINKYVESIYNKITTKLKIFSDVDLDNSIKQVKQSFSEVDEQEIITVIKRLTQFSSYKSLGHIGEQLQEQGITDITDLGELHPYFRYFYKRRNLFTLSNSENKKIGVIFTKNDINNKNLMRELKAHKDNPVFKNIVFVNLEGFSDGVNLFTDNYKLPELTVKILKEAKNLQNNNSKLIFDECVDQVLNSKIESSLKSLGFNVYTLKNDEPASKASILRQMAPIIPTKEEIFSTVDAIADRYSPENITYKYFSKSIAKYYDENVNIYSKQSIIEDLKRLNEKIKIYMQNNNIPSDNIYLIEYNIEEPKSFDIINRMYKDLFDVPKEKTIKLFDIAEVNRFPENSVFVVLDDIAGTGQSMIEIGGYYKEAPYISKNHHIIFAPITATKDGLDFVQKNINTSAREASDAIITLEENIAANWQDKNVFNGIITKIFPSKYKNISQKGEGKQALCTAFPYMSPDNNSYISSNLVRLFLPTEKCIKSLPDDFKEIQENALYYNLFGQKKSNLKLNSDNEEAQSWFSKLRDFFFSN